MKLTLRLAVTLLMAAMSSLAFGQDLPDKFFDSNGVRIRYLEQGTGEPVVLVHGFSTQIERIWIPSSIFQQLAKNYRVIALDCRGHGKSDKPHDVKQYGREMALDVARLLDHLKIQKAHIVGYSQGGGLTLQLVTMNPERFLTATIGGTAGRFAYTEEEIKRVNQMADEMEKGSARTLILSLWPTDQPKPTEEELKKREAAVIASQDIIALAAVRRSNVDQIVTEKQVAAIKVPTLAIVGTADPKLEDVNKLKKFMPQLKVVTIEGATHGGDRAAFNRPEFIQALELLWL